MIGAVLAVAALAFAPQHAWRHPSAVLRHATFLRASPGGRPVARVGIRTQFGSPTVFAVLGRRGGWLKVASSALRNGQHAWIPARRTVASGSDDDIVVDRSAHRATLRHDGHAVLRFPVAVGRPGNATPLGRFAVTDKLRVTNPASPYGCCALALTGHQTELEPGWPGGDRLAIHGTQAPASIGHAVSLGCMRASEHVMRTLIHRVPLGSPVVVHA